MTVYSAHRPRVTRVAPTVASWRSLRQTRAAVELGRVVLVALCVLAVYTGGQGADGHDLLVVAALSATWVLALRLGRGTSPEPLGPAVATTMGTLVGFVGVSALSLWLGAVELSPGRSLGMAFAVLLFLGVWESVVHRTTAARRRVLVVGAPETAETVAHETSRDHAPVDVVGLVRDRAGGVCECEVPVLGELDALSDLMEELHPDVVVVSDGAACDSALDRLLDVPRDGFRVVGLTSFFEHALGRVPLVNLQPSWFLSLLHVRQRGYTRWTKRAFDIVSATVALVLAVPVMAVIVAALAPTGCILYRQTRLGERGRRFTVVKFRTMSMSAEEGGRAVWCSGDGDPRVTRLGRVLRRAHLDELPQLLNVLRGDMSMVGPRPERPEFVDLLESEVPFWHRRLLVKPGVTGWAQLKGGYASDCEAMAAKLSYDLWYLRNRTVLVDTAICAATALQMVTGLAGRLHHVETVDGVGADVFGTRTEGVGEAVALRTSSSCGGKT
jgi:exopolysaccharide biosynthesis polyprenyl glycosylphosphotransferase